MDRESEEKKVAKLWKGERRRETPGGKQRRASKYINPELSFTLLRRLCVLCVVSPVLLSKSALLPLFDFSQNVGEPIHADDSGGE